jgi:hypothetical protein
MSITLEPSSDYSLATQDFCLALAAGSCGVVCACIEASSYIFIGIGALGITDSAIEIVVHPLIRAGHIKVVDKSIPSFAQKVLVGFASYGVYRTGMNMLETFSPMRIKLLERAESLIKRAYNHL